LVSNEQIQFESWKLSSRLPLWRYAERKPHLLHVQEGVILMETAPIGKGLHDYQYHGESRNDIEEIGMHLKWLNEAIITLSPIIVAVLAAFVSWSTAKKFGADRVLERITSESASLEKLQDGTSEKDSMQEQLNESIALYRTRRRVEDSRVVSWGAVFLGACIALVGLALTWWATNRGGLLLWWLVLATPMIMIGGYGFFTELRGRTPGAPPAPSP
jgi:hypothetical protein